MRFLAVYLLMCALALLVGCGGGGGNEVADGMQDTEVDDFVPRDGTFLTLFQFGVGLDSRVGSDLAAYSGEGTSEDYIAAKPGATPLLRDGAYRWDVQENRDGVLSGRLIDAIYSLDEDGTFSFTGAPDGLNSRGGVSVDGDYGVVARGEAGQGMQLLALVSPAESPQFDETGAYHQMGFTRFRVTAQTQTTYNTALMQSGHTLAHQEGLSNFDGVVGVRSEQYGDYERHGSFLRLGSPLNHKGAFSRDGHVAIVGGSVQVGGSPHMRVLIKQSSSASDATLEGTYYVGALGDNGSIESATGIVTFDGAGAGVYQVVATNGTNTADSGEIAFVYSVSANGQVEVDINGQLRLLGAVTEDGRFATLAGGMRNGETPLMVVLVRR